MYKGNELFQRPPQRASEIQLSGEKTSHRNKKQKIAAGRKQELPGFAVGQGDLPPLRDGKAPDLPPVAATPRASLGDRHSPSRAVGPGVPWEEEEEEEEEEEGLSHPGQRMFPVPRLKARGRGSSLPQLFGSFPSYMRLLTIRWRLELKV